MKSSVLLKGWQRSLGQAIANLDRAHSKALGNSKHKSRESGFTLLEMLILLLIVGILSAIAAPGWLAFINNQRLRTSQSRVYGAMQLAQSNAKRDKVAWQASFRTQDGVVQWAIHPTTKDPTNLDPINVPVVWYSLEEKIAIATTGTAPTTLIEVDLSTDLPKSGTKAYRAIFNRQGCIVDDAAKECTDTSTLTLPQRITLQHDQLGARRCAVVETLLGAMRTGDDATSCNLN